MNNCPIVCSGVRLCLFLRRTLDACSGWLLFTRSVCRPRVDLGREDVQRQRRATEPRAAAQRRSVHSPSWVRMTLGRTSTWLTFLVRHATRAPPARARRPKRPHLLHLPRAGGTLTSAALTIEPAVAHLPRVHVNSIWDDVRSTACGVCRICCEFRGRAPDRVGNKAPRRSPRRA